MYTGHRRAFACTLFRCARALMLSSNPSIWLFVWIIMVLNNVWFIRIWSYSMCICRWCCWCVLRGWDFESVCVSELPFFYFSESITDDMLFSQLVLHSILICRLILSMESVWSICCCCFCFIIYRLFGICSICFGLRKIVSSPLLPSNVVYSRISSFFSFFQHRSSHDKQQQQQ